MRPIDPEVVSQLLARTRRHQPIADLSPREREVLGLMAEGRSNTAIADELVITQRAVEKHVKTSSRSCASPRPTPSTVACSPSSATWTRASSRARRGPGRTAGPAAENDQPVNGT